MPNIIHVSVPDTAVKVIKISVPGVQGPRGIQGIQGERGIGIPAGGSTGQLVVKISPTEAGWTTLTSSLITDSSSIGRELITTSSAESARTTLNAVSNGDVEVAATPDKIIRRDANGRAKVTDPLSAGDIATMGYVDGKTTSAALTLASGWTGTAAWASVGKVVTVTISVTRTGSALNMAAWASTPVATGLPAPAVVDGAAHAIAATNQYEYGAFSFVITSTGLQINARWASRTFATNGWLQGSFSYVAA